MTEVGTLVGKNMLKKYNTNFSTLLKLILDMSDEQQSILLQHAQRLFDKRQRNRIPCLIPAYYYVHNKSHHSFILDINDSGAFVETNEGYPIGFNNRWMQQSFNRLLEQYELLSAQIDKQTQLLKQLSHLPLYHDRVKILCSVPGIGLLTAMEILLELQDFSRFRRAEQLAAYVGLTPSQYSSADKIRMGHITAAGKNTVRAALVESCWQLIRKDKAMRKKYEQIKARAGGKRAIVAISRKLILCIRRLLLDNRLYEYEPVS